jgi:hypothetical protein
MCVLYLNNHAAYRIFENPKRDYLFKLMVKVVFFFGYNGLKTDKKPQKYVSG